MSRRRRGTSILVAICILLLPLVARGSAMAAEAKRGPTLGVLWDETGARDWPEASGEAPPIVRLTADWQAIERSPGIYDWSAVEPTVSRLSAAGYRVALSLTGSNRLYLPEGGTPSALAPEALEAWLGFVRSASRSFAGQASTFQIWDEVGGAAESEFTPEDYAFVLKNSALAVRAEARASGASARVAQAALAPGALDWQRRLWGNDVAAYIDIFPAVLRTGGNPDGISSALDELSRENLLHPPAAELWAYLEPSGGASRWAPIASAVRALASGVGGALARVRGTEEPDPIAWIVSANGLLAEGYAPAPLGALRFESATGGALEGARALGRFFSSEDFSTLIFYEAEGALQELPQDRMIVDTNLVRDAMHLDPATGRRLRVAATAAEGESRGRAIRINTAPYPMAVSFRKGPASPGFELPPEAVDTTAQRELTAEEIIARYQQVQRIQDDALERWMARGRVDFHFKLAQGGATVDVSVESNYFWERGGQLEWEQTDYYVNGNRVKWKKIPELPLIQPEKVITLPLDLTLDKTYSYRRVGRERVGDREAYVLEFQPTDPDAPTSLYRGKVWVDVSSFVRLKASIVQTGLDTPVLSNEEVDRFALHDGPGGQEFWMLSEIDGQQIWSAAGRNFVVRRELSFESFTINPRKSEFEQLRQQAYASTNQMLRDTDEGFRYLERQEDGTRVIKTGVDKSALFAAAGAFKDSSTDGVTPLAGVNYFNYDLRGKGIQFNVLFGGVIGFVTASKPDLFGKRIDGTLDVTGAAIKFTDQVFEGDDELEEEAVDRRSQTFALRLGVPIGQFFKVSLVGRQAYRQYFDAEDSEDAIEAFNSAVPAPPEQLEFVLPPDHWESTGRLEAEFNRRGYTISGSGAWSRRSEWEAWGLRDSLSGLFGRVDRSTGLFVPGSAPEVEESFSKWGVTAFKEWYLPKFQKLRAQVSYLDGSDLDRFSRYQFSFFGDDRLNGFSGSGVRFDQGLLVRTGYAFNLFEVIRFDAALETARVEEFGSGIGEQSFTGLGLSGNFVGPWKTVINFNYGYALSSDIPDLEGEQEFLLLVFKLF